MDEWTYFMLRHGVPVFFSLTNPTLDGSRLPSCARLREGALCVMAGFDGSVDYKGSAKRTPSTRHRPCTVWCQPVTLKKSTFQKQFLHFSNINTGDPLERNCCYAHQLI